MNLICPICEASLERKDNIYRCHNKHSFDIARQGYVNLLAVQQKHSLNPGDTRQQVIARRAFLSEGFYSPIAEALKTAAAQLGAHGPILDIGCGEGYYSTQLAQAMNAELIGIDISKEAVRCAAGKYKNACWLCATASHLPIKSESIGTLTSLFALTIPGEFFRVLKPTGLYLQVIAAEDHLMGLKSIIYPELIQKEKNVKPEVEGFTNIESIPIQFSFTVRDAQVQNLLSMTPHAHRITKEGAERIGATKVLTDKASCILNIYKPNKS